MSYELVKEVIKDNNKSDHIENQAELSHVRNFECKTYKMKLRVV